VQCEPVDVAALARRVLADVAGYTAGHQILLQAPQAPQGSLALADADRVEDILVNLLANAGKYAPQGTPIRVEIATVSPASPASGSPAPASAASAASAAPAGGAWCSGTQVEVRVIDQGPGIPEEEQAAVFERFRRGQGASGGGVGLGLYIARAYVEAMGGEIGVRSRPEAGATFWFRLPAAVSPAGSAGAVELVQLAEPAEEPVEAGRG
jgi:signal transduction histidine kinase